MSKSKSPSFSLYKVIEEKIQGFLLEKKSINENLANEIFNLCYRDFYQYFYFMLKNKELAEDLTQDTLMKVYQSHQKFDSKKASFKTWAWTIAKNNGIDFLRSREFKDKKDTISWSDIGPEEFQISAEDFFENDPILAQLLEQEKNLDIQKAIMLLNERNRSILLTWLNDELSMDELAKVHSTSVQNIKNSLFNSKKKLKDFFHEK